MTATIAANCGGFNSFASSITTSAMNVPNGDAVWIGIQFGTALGQTLSSVTDNAGNTYVQKEAFSYPAQNLQWYLYVADNVTGNAALVVTVTLSANAIIIAEGLDITGQPASSYVGSGTATFVDPYGTDTLETSTIIPSSPSSLLLAFAIGKASFGFAPTLTYNIAGTSTFVVDGFAGGGTSTSIGIGIYQAPSGSGSQTLTGGEHIASAPPNPPISVFRIQTYECGSAGAIIKKHLLPLLGVGA